MKINVLSALWFPSMMCFVELILSTVCHIISVGVHLHWYFKMQVVYNFIWEHIFGQTSCTWTNYGAIVC